jgi:Beta-eliminating lyase
MQPRVNLFSDTQTTPTPEMRRAMASADVGDEQLGADPTVNALCDRVAAMLGLEAAVFLPSGTMCNEIAFRVHIGPGGDALKRRERRSGMPRSLALAPGPPVHAPPTSARPARHGIDNPKPGTCSTPSVLRRARRKC